MAKIYGNMVGGGGGGGLPKSYILETEGGARLVGVLVGEETIFDATDNDVREGKTYASDNGVSTGTKVIPSYNTFEGYKIITSGSEFKVKLAQLDLYDYTKLQALFCAFNTSLSNSVATDKISINGNVYNVESIDVLATVTKNDIDKTIEFGITNNTDIPYIVRYFTYKEIY